MGIKGKIVSIISFICLTICLFMVGVWALTETDFSVSGDIEYTAPVTADDVGTYSTLKFFVNNDGENTVSVMANPDNKPTGELVIPAHVSSGGTVYTVTRIDYSTAETLSTQEVSVTPRAPSGPSLPGGESGTGAFYSCQITKIIIPEGISIIGASAFGQCTALTSVTIPKSVVSIGDVAFSGCTYLTEVNYLGDINQWGYIQFATYDSNPIYCAKGLKINGEEVTNAVFDTATGINAFAFYNNTKLISVSFGKMKGIGMQAFRNCSNLANINILCDRLDISINSLAFANCGKLANIAKGIYFYIAGPNAFQYCTSLKSIEFSEGMTSIPNNVFLGCSLTSITIPDSVTSIGEYAFTGIDTANFKYSAVENGAKYIGKTSNPYFILYKATSIASCTINSKCKIIYTSAFKECIGLSSVTIPYGVETIGDNAFAYCSNLTSVTIPASVTKIGNGALRTCENLTELIMQGATPPSLTSNEFHNCAKLKTIYVPTTEAREAYCSAANWSDYYEKFTVGP